MAKLVVYLIVTFILGYLTGKYPVTLDDDEEEYKND